MDWTRWKNDENDRKVHQIQQSSFSKLSVTSPTLQLILQPFRRFTYVTSSSLNSPGESPMAFVLYASETWTLNVDIFSQLGVFERKALRRILGAVFDGGNSRRRYNDELMAMYGELDMTSTIRLSRLEMDWTCWKNDE